MTDFATPVPGLTRNLAGVYRNGEAPARGPGRVMLCGNCIAQSAQGTKGETRHA